MINVVKVFVDFRCSILVFANILHGIAVLGTPNSMVQEVTYKYKNNTIILIEYNVEAKKFKCTFT